MTDRPAAGYSKRPLTAKLGIKAHTRIAILNAPADYDGTLGTLPDGVIVVREVRQVDETFDLIQIFAMHRAELDATVPTLKLALAQHGKLWISWPKKAAKTPTDLNGNIVREIGLMHGLVDIKVAAIDAIWSGLQFVHRLQDRRQADAGLGNA